jgi:amino acid adenylation domain-containing protein
VTMQATRTMTPGLLSAILDRVAADPTATAIEDGGQVLTYAELLTAAQGVAARLRERGVEAGEPVGVAAVREASTIVAMLGILLADAAFVPLDPADPPGRLADIAHGVGLRQVVTPARHLATFAGVGVGCLLPGGAGDAGCVGAGWEQSPEALAYVIHTSGTTGRPKGVGIPRQALEHFSRVAVDYYEMRPGDRILQFVSMSFDACIEEIFPPLLAGATIVFRDDDMISSIDRFLERCAALGITIMFLPTAYWHELVDAMVRDGLELPGPVRLVTAGGEEIRADRVADWRRLRLDPRVRLVNEYGPTETTVVATVEELAGPRSNAETLDEPTVGRPLPGVRFRVVDEGGDDVTPGAYGELLLGGPIVATGYLGQPELTGQRFSTGADGVRYYRTGDRVRLRADGRLGFRGRMDRQVKVRGFRIEPAEVEQALLAYPAVRDAAVHLDRDRAALTAYLIMTGTDLEGLRAHLKEQLPAHAVPSRLIPVEAFPRNDRDKIDFAALAAGTTAAEVEGTGTEARLTAIVREVLGAAGPDDSLFDLGAHSLSMVQISTRITREFGIRLPLAELHAEPTIAGLARLLATREVSTFVPAESVAADAVLPLTAFQRDTWLAERFHPGTPLHTIGLRYRITGPADPTRVGAALNALVVRHDALRAVFRQEGDEPVMVFGGPARPVPLDVHDLRALPEGERSVRADQLRHERGRTVLDPAAGELIAATLIDDELVVAVHHLAFDGWSATVLAQDLADLLAGSEPAPAGSYAAHLAREVTPDREH